MRLCLTHPQYGYYMNRDPFGAEGDFTPRREISQMFGELIGLWAAEVWTAMGAPEPVAPDRTRPGRGTLDERRAARGARRAGISHRARVCLTSRPARPGREQHDTLLTAGAPVSWAAGA